MLLRGASFATSAVLLPAGVHGLHRAAEVDPRWVPLALFPLTFGVQQALEGVVWLQLDQDRSSLLLPAAYAFVFFSHLFWPLWGPLSAHCAEQDGGRRRALGAMTVAGGLYGASLYVPIVWNGWLDVTLERGSLVYDTGLIYDGFVPRDALRIVYALLVIPPFFISSRRGLRAFGILLAATVLVAYAFFDHAFISVWCFFAAVISVFIIYLLRQHPRTDLRRGSLRSPMTDERSPRPLPGGYRPSPLRPGPTAGMVATRTHAVRVGGAGRRVAPGPDRQHLAPDAPGVPTTRVLVLLSRPSGDRPQVILATTRASAPTRQARATTRIHLGCRTTSSPSPSPTQGPYPHLGPTTPDAHHIGLSRVPPTPGAQAGASSFPRSWEG